MRPIVDLPYMCAKVGYNPVQTIEKTLDAERLLIPTEGMLDSWAARANFLKNAACETADKCAETLAKTAAKHGY